MIEVTILYRNRTWDIHSFSISDDDADFLYEECSKYEYETEQDNWFLREYFDDKVDLRLKDAIAFIVHGG